MLLDKGIPWHLYLYQRVEEELKEERERSEDMEQRLEGDINDLQDSLDEAHQEIENLARYKKGYDDLYYGKELYHFFFKRERENEWMNDSIFHG